MIFRTLESLLSIDSTLLAGKKQNKNSLSIKEENNARN
jgi:hypothetical protein